MLFLLETLLFFMSLKDQPLTTFFLYNLALPTGSNIAILIIGGIIYRLTQEKQKFQEYLPLAELSAICIITAFLYGAYPATTCLLTLPLFLSVIYGKPKTTCIIFGISCLFTAVTTVYRFHNANHQYLAGETTVASVLLLASYIACNLLIRFQMEMQEQLNRRCV